MDDDSPRIVQNGVPLLHRAAAHGDVDFVDMLLKFNADVDLAEMEVCALPANRETI